MTFCFLPLRLVADLRTTTGYAIFGAPYPPASSDTRLQEHRVALRVISNQLQETDTDARIVAVAAALYLNAPETFRDVIALLCDRGKLGVITWPMEDAESPTKEAEAIRHAVACACSKALVNDWTVKNLYLMHPDEDDGSFPDNSRLLALHRLFLGPYHKWPHAAWRWTLPKEPK